MGPAAHWLSGTAAAVATAGVMQEERQGGGCKGLEKEVADAGLVGGWVAGGGDKTRNERCTERKGMR